MPGRQRADVLRDFLSTDEGRDLLAGYKRASSIVGIEEDRDGRMYHGKPNPRLYLQKEERELAVCIAAARHEATVALARGDFEQAVHALATLRPFIDSFFREVTVNVPAADRRENRLRLLNELRDVTHAVAGLLEVAPAAPVSTMSYAIPSA